MLDVPHYRQARVWSCGPASVRMILAYYACDETEADLIDELGASAKTGTHPEDIERALTKRGLPCRQAVNGHTLRLAVATRPVLVVYQDHAPRGTDYSTCWDHGHYAVVVACDRQSITLADPSSKRPRRKLKLADFFARWHDIDSTGRVFRQWGIAVGPRK